MRPPIRSKLAPVLVRAVGSWLVAAGLLVASMLAGAPASHALDSPDYSCHISGRLHQSGVVTRDNPYAVGDVREFRAYDLGAGGVCSSNDPARPWVGRASLRGSMVEYGYTICVSIVSCPLGGVSRYPFLTDHVLDDNWLTMREGTRHVLVELSPEPGKESDTDVVHPATQGVMTMRVWDAEHCNPLNPLDLCIAQGNGVVAFVYDDPLRPEPFNGGDLTFEGTLEMS